MKGLKQSQGPITNIGTGLKQTLVMFDVYNGMRQEVRSFFFSTKKSLLNLLLKNLQYENRLLPCLDLYMLSLEVSPSSCSTRAAKNDYRSRVVSLKSPQSKILKLSNWFMCDQIFAYVHSDSRARSAVSWWHGNPGRMHTYPTRPPLFLNRDIFPSFCRWRSFLFSLRMVSTQTAMKIWPSTRDKSRAKA